MKLKSCTDRSIEKRLLLIESTWFVLFRIVRGPLHHEEMMQEIKENKMISLVTASTMYNHAFLLSQA